jgi:phthiocerol/phenolphthiocerol synthesis type-I polyketide synthase E
MLSGGQMLPASYGRVRYAAPLPGAFLAHLHSPRRAEGDESLMLDLTLMAPDGEVLVEIGDFLMRRLAEGGRRPAVAAAAPANRPATGGSADWILPLEGVEAFRRILSRGRFAQIAVSPLDLNRTIAAMRKRAEERSTAEPAAPRTAFPRPGLATAYVPPATETETRLAELWKGVLGLDQVGVQDNFFDLGGDSIIGIQIVARATVLGLQFSPEQLFEHQTIAELAAWLSAPRDAQTAAAPPPEPDAIPIDGVFADADLSSTELDKIFSQLKELS